MGEAVKVTACHQEPGDGGENSKESWWGRRVRKLNKVNRMTWVMSNISPTSETHAGEQRKREEEEESKEQGMQLVGRRGLSRIERI